MKRVFNAVVAIALFTDAILSARGDETAPVSPAHADYLRAMLLAEEGSKPEALRVLAESLRLEPKNNPAASLAFQLLAELRTNSSFALHGHTGGVLAAAYSPDGTRIVTASEDHTARIWDAQNGHELFKLSHANDVGVAVFSADGKRVATGSDDKTARVWDAATGKPVGAVMTSPDEFRSMQFSPDGKLLATGTDDGRARVWNAETGVPLFEPVRYHETVFTVSFSPDSKRLLTSTDIKAEILDAQTGKALLPLHHENNVFTAVFSADGTRVLTASADRTARIWDAATGQPLAPVFSHGYWISSAAFNADATRVVTASWDHTACVWDAATGHPITPPLMHGDAVLGASFSPDGTRVVTASKDGSARVWDAATGDPLTLPIRPEGEVTSAIFDRTGATVLVTSKDSVVRLHDLAPTEAPPEWLADLADFAATQVRYDVARVPDSAKINTLREKLLASTPGDPWEKFGRWYFLEGDVRPVSPWSTLSLKDCVDDLAARGDRESLDEAIALARDRPAWMVKLVPLREKLGKAPEKKADGDRD